MNISVVIPLYNKADTIVRAVRSVQAQTCQDWELIVVDDGSKDEGASLVEALGDPRIRVIRQRNAGVSVARNTGIAQARHEWVALLDADDYWAEQHLARLVLLQQRFPKAAMLASTYICLDDMGQMRPIPVDARFRSAPDAMAAIPDFFADAVAQQHIAVHSSSVMVPRDLCLKVGGFPPGITAGEDQVMWARLACAGPVAVSFIPTAIYVEPAINAAERHRVVRRPALPDEVGAIFGPCGPRRPIRTRWICTSRTGIASVRCLGWRSTSVGNAWSTCGWRSGSDTSRARM
ncbi:MAG: glycosyltransferase family 2 protein [Aquabacterium sp.]